MIFRSENLPNHSPVLGGSSGPALTMEGNMYTIEEIKNAVDIVIGDDGMRSKEVIEILKHEKENESK